MTHVAVYDCTLRDGMQGEGMSLSVAEQVQVAHVLDELGVPYVEAGFPMSNPKDAALFEALEHAGLRATVAAFGMTRRRGLTAETDPAVRALVDAWTPMATFVGKTWKLHLEKVVKVSAEENLAMVGETVALAVSAGKEVCYDAEHFFDAWLEDPAYALECVRVAAEAGAGWVALCDTNGATMPDQVAAAVADVRRALEGSGAQVGFHGHDDCGLGVANALSAVDAGATMVQGTLNGYGERTGNTNLTTLVPVLQLKRGHDVLPSLATWTQSAHLVDELANKTPDPDAPFVGRNAFAHKGGMHVAGVNADPRTFEHLDPASVGNHRDVLVSELSGKATVLARRPDLDDDAAAKVLEELKEREHRGFQFEAADGSFDLLIARELGEAPKLFTLESWRVIADKRTDGRVQTEATVKVWVEGERHVHTAEGNGPVNALDAALRAALVDRYPAIGDIRLTNYKVRIMDGHKATGANTRVIISATDGADEWGAIGVSENVIEASWDALVDSLLAGFLPGRHAPVATTSAA